MGNEQYEEYIEEKYNTEYYDDVSVENGSAEDKYLTINNMSTVNEINEAQINVDPNTREEEIQDVQCLLIHIT